MNSPGQAAAWQRLFPAHTAAAGHTPNATRPIAAARRTTAAGHCRSRLACFAHSQERGAHQKRARDVYWTSEVRDTRQTSEQCVPE